MEDNHYTFKVYLVGGNAVTFAGCPDDLIEEMLERFKKLDKDDFFEQDYGHGGYVSIPARNILYVDTFDEHFGPLT